MKNHHTKTKSVGGVLMSLGKDIQFSVSEGAYQKLDQKFTARVAVMNRAGRASSRQMLGLDHQIDIAGVVFPEQAARHKAADKIAALQDAFAAMQPLMLTDGRGRVWGMFVIESLSLDDAVFLDNGQPLRRGFSISLGAFGDEADEAS